MKVTNLLLIAGNSRMAGPPGTAPLGSGEAALGPSHRFHPLLGPQGGHVHLVGQMGEEACG